MKKLLIYYSLTGNGDLVAEFLKESFDIRKVNHASTDKMLWKGTN